VLDDFAGASRGLGVVNQHNTLWDDLSCLDHLLFFAALRTKVGHERIALTTLAQLELSHHAHKMAGRLSGAVWESNCRVASARWRGDTGSSPLDGTSAAMRSPRNDLVKNYRCTRHTG
jgi:ABC-type nitrate/sulfonate/bicarbonate transport system ATPase subunit